MQATLSKFILLQQYSMFRLCLQCVSCTRHDQCLTEQAAEAEGAASEQLGADKAVKFKGVQGVSLTHTTCYYLYE
jgi:hypothetical protein